VRLLAAAGTRLAASLDYAATLQAIAELVVPALADYCTIDVLEGDGRLHRLGVAHVEPAGLALLEAARAYPPEIGGDSPLTAALAGGGAVLVGEVTPDWLERATRPGEHRRLVEALGPRSLLLVPLVAHDRPLGLLTLVSTRADHRYDEVDLALTRELAVRCALAIDKARLYREALEAVAIRDQVLGAVSHDLQNPLGTIRGLTQMMQRRLRRLAGPEAGELAEPAARIEVLTRRMGGMVRDLLDAVRLQLGEALDLDCGPVDLVTLVRRVVAEQQPAAGSERVRVTASVGALVGRWDGARLERVVANLVANALKYSPAGHPVEVTIGREETADEEVAVLTVRDQGVGIPAADLPHIFTPFRRGRNVAGRVQGTGFGLAGSRHIVERHGGRIEVASVEGAGSAFTVRLPLGGPAGSGR
jgi:signal transduction histidine kinase